MASISYKKQLQMTLHIDSQVVDRLFSLFFTTIKVEFDNLKSAIDTMEMEKMYEVAHKISGSASNLGLTEIRDIAKEIEVSAKEHSNIDYQALFKVLLESYEVAYAKVNNEI